MLNKKICREFAAPGIAMSMDSGLLHAEQVKYIVQTAVKIIDHQKTLVLYIHDREQAAQGVLLPVWTMFHCKDGYITLERKEGGKTSWRAASFDNLGDIWRFVKDCAFYSPEDRERLEHYGGHGVKSKGVIAQPMADKKKRRARGEGTIRQRPNGTWEARFVTGVDPGTGKDIRKSVYGKTQKEVRKKMTEAIAALDKDDYRVPCKMNFAQWLDIWSGNYWNDIKNHTRASYAAHIRNHIKPCLGAVKLDALTPHMIQQFYNGLLRAQDGHEALNPKTVHNCHGVLHSALEKAVAIGYLRSNPADACTLPKKTKKEIKPLDDDDTAIFLKAIKGHRFETIYLTDVFTGMRRGEVCGLTWDCVDFKAGSILINKQLQKERGKDGKYVLPTTKSDKSRVIVPAPFVMDALKTQRAMQAEWRLKAGPCWEGDALGDFVFTDELGRHLIPDTVYRNFKRIVKAVGLPETRLHDLRHTFAVASLRSGDDYKTVQGNLGHATASFTLDVYGHVTDQMKRESADRMQQYIEKIKKNG